MKLIKIRLPDDNMAVYDIQGLRKLKDGNEVITKADLIATKIGGDWRKSGREPGNHDSLGVDSAAFDSMPIAIDMAPGMIYKYEPTVQPDGETVALERVARPKP